MERFAYAGAAPGPAGCGFVPTAGGARSVVGSVGLGAFSTGLGLVQLPCADDAPVRKARVVGPPVRKARVAGPPVRIGGPGGGPRAGSPTWRSRRT